MSAGLSTNSAILVIGFTMATMSASWSPSCRSGTPELARRVSRFTWPEITTMPMESV